MKHPILRRHLTHLNTRLSEHQHPRTHGRVIRVHRRHSRWQDTFRRWHLRKVRQGR